MNDMKLCIDCKFRGGVESGRVCLRRIPLKEPDYVYGKVDEPLCSFCKSERSYIARCGPEAKFFEEKEIK